MHFMLEIHVLYVVNEIESLNEHINFDEIAKNQNLIKEVNNQLNKK